MLQEPCISSLRHPPPFNNDSPPLVIFLASDTISSIRARSAAESSSMGLESILLHTMRMGLLEKSGLIEWNRAAWGCGEEW